MRQDINEISIASRAMCLHSRIPTRLRSATFDGCKATIPLIWQQSNV